MLINKINSLKNIRSIKPSIIIGLITLIFLISSIIWIFFENEFLRLELQVIKKDNLPAIEIDGAKFVGETKLGKKYFIEAKKIINSNTKDNVKLTSIYARISDIKKLILISSDKGTLNTKNFFFELNGDVKLTDKSKNLEVFTQKMNGNINNGDYLTSDVYAVIKSARISSSQMQFRENENIILFKGETFLRIN
tara:strand:+ start:132 stop:713 length:582 start_codon:yes stop_codon:yes gene_type:complete